MEVPKSRGNVVGLGIGFLGGHDCSRSIGVGLAVLFGFSGRSIRMHLGRFWVSMPLSLI